RHHRLGTRRRRASGRNVEVEGRGRFHGGTGAWNPRRGGRRGGASRGRAGRRGKAVADRVGGLAPAGGVGAAVAARGLACRLSPSTYALFRFRKLRRSSSRGSSTRLGRGRRTGFRRT